MNSARFQKKKNKNVELLREHTRARRGKINEFSRAINRETETVLRTNGSFKAGVSVFRIGKYRHAPRKHFKQRIAGEEQTNANVA